jgi:hypothetical protein
MKPEPPKRPVGELVYLCGGEIDQVSVTLLLKSEDLDPQRISALLQCEPTSAHRKGDVLPSKKYQRTAKFGLWCLKVPRISGKTLEEQILLLLSMLPSEVSVWHQVTASAEAQLFCGLWLKTWNRELDLLPSTLSEIAQRGLILRLDIYFDGSEEKES